MVPTAAGFGLASLGAQGLIHWSWTQDRWTGFMDLESGALSAAGWWHLGFASVETTFMLLFLLLWIINRRSEQAQAVAARGWTTVLLYFGLGAADYLVQLMTVYRDLPLLASLSLQWPVLPKVTVAVVVSIWARSGAAGR